VNTKEKVWIKQRELEIAIWVDTLKTGDLNPDMKKVYRNAIANSKKDLKDGFKEG